VVQTRRPRQKSANRLSTRISGLIPRIGSVDPDFCRARQTKPIGRDDQLWKTNPISRGAGWDEAPGAWDAGQSCETKPISV
jgi:hypothetical protein